MRQSGPLAGQAVKALKSRPDRVEKVRGGEEWQQVDPADMDPKLRQALYKMNPKQVALFCAWVINGRNISAAGRQVGFHPVYARQLFTTHPAFKEAKRYLQSIVLMEDQEWIDCLPQARQTLRSLLVAKDEKVRYLAAKDIVDRAEGKAVARMDMTIREDRPSITDAQMQLIFSIMQTMSVGFAEAKAWVEKHPEESQKWIDQHVQKTLPAGREVAEVPAPNRDFEEAEVVLAHEKKHEPLIARLD
jgi:hypothetical protein